MGLSQLQVATHLGLKSTNRLSKWERGESLPNVINLFKLAILYKVLADQLYFDILKELRDDMIKKNVER